MVDRNRKWFLVAILEVDRPNCVVPWQPRLNKKRALFVLTQSDEILPKVDGVRNTCTLVSSNPHPSSLFPYS